jgi:DNA polymerase I-like protein with 3'-5' exonuclease and polymerase domains
LNIITNKEQLAEMVAYYLEQDSFAFDVETVGTHRGIPAVNEVLWISLATHGRGDVIPMGHPNGDFVELIRPLTGVGQKRLEAGMPIRDTDYSSDDKKATKVFTSGPEQLFPAEVFEALKPLMFHPNILKIGHNLGFDLSSVAKYYNNTPPSKPYFDTLMASFLYDNKNRGKLGLDDCLQRELGFSMQKGIGHKVEDYSFDEVAKYAYLDAKYTFLLWKVLINKLEESDVVRVMKLEMDVLEVLCYMKLEGTHIDIESLKALNIQLESEIEEAKAHAYSVVGQVFNMNSNSEKQYLLYGPKEEGCRGLKVSQLTGTGQKNAIALGAEGLTHKDYSVNAAALEELRSKDEFVDALVTYADLNKLQSTYVIPYLGGEVVKTVNGKSKIETRESMLVNGKLYADFIQWGAETGRFSSRNPNLQNIPNPEASENGKAIRNLFIAPEGYKLIVADYSQIEPRVIAAMSKDPIMMDNYLTGGDLYTTVGNTVGVDRKAGKVLVLAMAYGVGPDKISSQIGCTVQEAKALLNAFAEKFPSVSKYKQTVVGVARKKGYVTTIMGRRRYLPDINSRVMKFRSSSERQAFNTRIQGSAADIIKLAMIRAYERLPKEAKLILTVHDELVTIAPDSFVDQAKEAIRDAMEGINLLPIPLISDINVVQRWGEGHK